MRLVLDASAAVNALVPGHLRNATLRHFDGAELFAPALIDTEVVSALARLERAEVITTPEADSAVTAWTRLLCTKLETEPTIPAIWALRHFDGAELFAPALIDTEVLSALARLERTEVITTREADSAVTAWTRLPCTKLETEPTIPAIWALRHAVRVSDAHYAVVARILDAPLLTADVRLSRGHLPGVSVLTVG